VTEGGEEKNTYSVGPLRQSYPPSLKALNIFNIFILIFLIIYSSDNG
jgi:hypothetical protein